MDYRSPSSWPRANERADAGGLAGSPAATLAAPRVADSRRARASPSNPPSVLDLVEECRAALAMGAQRTTSPARAASDSLEAPRLSSRARGAAVATRRIVKCGDRAATGNQSKYS